MAQWMLSIVTIGLVPIVLLLAGPSLALALLLFRKRQARKRRRAPVSRTMLRAPGHSLREQLDEAQTDLVFDLMALMAFPSVISTFYLLHTRDMNPERAISLLGIYVGGVLLVLAYMLRKLWRSHIRIDQLRAGYDAELAAGQELDQLMRQGAYIFHDMPGEDFNIDHVVVAVQGVFAIETKGYTKPNRGKGREDATVVFDGERLHFPTWTTKAPLEQSVRQAVWLSQWLKRAVGQPVFATPVVALPGWFVERKATGPAMVFSGRQLPSLLKTGAAGALSEQDVQRVAHQIEQRCRTVAQRYRDSDGRI